MKDPRPDTYGGVDLDTIRQSPRSFGDVAVIEDMADEIQRLRAGLIEAIESVEYWAAYASPYSHERHDLNGELERLLGYLVGKN